MHFSNLAVFVNLFTNTIPCPMALSPFVVTGAGSQVITGESSPVSKTLSFETALADHQVPHPDGLFVPQNFVSIDLSQAQCCSMSFETEGGGNDPSRESY